MRPRLAAAVPALAALAGALAVPAAAGAAVPIPQGTPPTSLPAYSGHPATAHPISVPLPPRHPFMAPNGNSNLHDDPWMTDTYNRRGPLGRNPVTFSNNLSRVCGTMTFNRRGEILTVCVAPGGPRLFKLDPRTLDVKAEFTLPPKPTPPPGTNIFQDFTGGGYFYLDDRERVVTPTTTRHIWVVAQRGAGFARVRDYDVSKGLKADEKISSALPDWKGRIWFVTKSRGTVGYVEPRSGRVFTRRLNEEVENSFAIAKEGVYIASDKRQYRFEASARGPRLVWSVRYRNSGIRKPSQVDAGTGTTPTIMAGGYVTITDNADPMNVVVYRRAAKLRRGQRRTVCEVPVFRKGRSATENSLIAAGRSIIVENNYGYEDPTSVSGGKVTEPGVTRVDVARNGRGCRVVWRNTTERAPTVVPKLSLKTGLVHLYTKDPDPAGTSDPWYWTTLDFRTGRLVYKVFSGTGTSYNNNYAGIILGPDGTAYLGAIGGPVALRDGAVR